MTRVRVKILLALFLLLFTIFPFGPTVLNSKERPTLTKGKKIYSWYCTPCHGFKGDGKGFNAEYLNPKPANHTNAKEMSKRTDEKLYEHHSRGR